MAKTSRMDTERPEGKAPGDAEEGRQAGSRGMRAQGGGEQTTSGKLAGEHSKKVQAAVEKAWSAPQPERLRDVTFGRDAKGHGYRVHLAPVIREVAKALGGEANTAGFPKVREQLSQWEPDHKDWMRVKALLMCACDELSDAMGEIGADTLDDDFVLKAPDLAKSRREEANKTPSTV